MRNGKLFAKFLMILMAVVIVLAGCSSKESSSTKNSSESKDGSYEVTMAYMSFTNLDELQLVQDEINKIAKEKINATVKLMPISAGAWQQQSQLLLTGSEKIDLILSSSFYGYNTNAVKGQYVALDDLLKSHGKGIVEAVPDYILEGNKVGGKIYGIPSMRDYASYYGFIMRKDIVDKHNIDLSKIKTVADLEEVFKIVKEKEPTLTPITNTTLGIVTDLVWGKYDVLGESLGVMKMDGDKVINMFDDPTYVEAAELTRKWYEDGYVLKDSATSTEASVNIVKAGKGFGYFNHMKPGYEVQESVIAGHEMVAVKLSDAYSYTDASTGFNLSISRNTQNAEKTMEFLNLLYSDADVMNLLANGIEGKHYVLKDGVISTPEGVTESKYVFNQWMLGNNFLTYPWEGNSPDYWEVMKEHNDSATLSPAFGFTFNPDSVKTEIAAATNVMNEFKRGIESGTLDPDKSLPNFNKKLKDAGLDKIIAEKQKQYDEWKKNK
jgi:putative aldouronate transport system substrate-binding protein